MPWAPVTADTVSLARRFRLPIRALVRRPGNLPFVYPSAKNSFTTVIFQMIHTWAVNGLCEGRRSNADVFLRAFRRRNCGRVEVENHFMRRAHVPCCATSRFTGRAPRPFRLSQQLHASGVGRPPACRRSFKIGGCKCKPGPWTWIQEFVAGWSEEMYPPVLITG